MIVTLFKRLPSDGLAADDKGEGKEVAEGEEEEEEAEKSEEDEDEGHGN